MRCSDLVSLAGVDGELLAVRLTVDPREVEDALEALAHVPFPINPEIKHPAPGDHSWQTLIEFPAYAGQLPELTRRLREAGLAAVLTSCPMLAQLRGD